MKTRNMIGRELTMPIYRLSANVISRSSGRSSVAAAAYRAGVDLTNARDGLTHKYSNRQDVVHAEILLPSHAPEMFADRSTLWNAVEQIETRKNSQTAREIQLSLPCELTDAERLELVRDFARAQFVEQGMIADIAIHAPGGEGDDRNHHAHILLTTREVDSEGFTTKNREWNNKQHLVDWREEWAVVQNHHLERYELSVDHRSIYDQRQEHLEHSVEAIAEGHLEEAAGYSAKAQELDREPRVYLGREDYKAAMRDKGSPQARLLALSYSAIDQAKELAEGFLSSTLEQLAQGLNNAKDAWGEFWDGVDVDEVSDNLQNDLGGAREERDAEIEDALTDGIELEQ